MFGFCFLPLFLVRCLRSSGKRTRNAVLPRGERLLAQRWKLNSNESREIEICGGGCCGLGDGGHGVAGARNGDPSYTGTDQGRKKISARRADWIALCGTRQLDLSGTGTARGAWLHPFRI